jgi:hypothetical protein
LLKQKFDREDFFHGYPFIENIILFLHHATYFSTVKRFYNEQTKILILDDRIDIDVQCKGSIVVANIRQWTVCSKLSVWYSSPDFKGTDPKF